MANPSDDDGNDCFSALQRAENSSMRHKLAIRSDHAGFSALQRAENSSIPGSTRSSTSGTAFQCSSASRKFLNVTNSKASHFSTSCFSALQRAENSSINGCTLYCRVHCRFSALQRAENSSICDTLRVALVLARFQCSSASRKFLNNTPFRALSELSRCFSALQRAENSSITIDICGSRKRTGVSVLFSEPKIPQ